MRITNMRDILEKTAIDHVYYRAYDPMVRCVGREYTPNRSAQIAMLVASGRLDWTPDVVESMYWSFNSKIDQIWNRSNSEEIFDIDEGDWNRSARADLVDAGKAPAWAKVFEENVKSSGSMYGLKEDSTPVEKADVLYILDEITRAKTPEVGEVLQSVLDKAGIKYAVLKKGTDGWGLYDLGFWSLAEEKAKEFAGFIKESGAKTIVANNSAVVYALREWYPKLGIELNAEVLHHTEYLDKLGVSGKFDKKVTYHDSAYLGRYLGVFDAPRNVLGKVSGLDLKECFFNLEKSNPTGPLYGFFDEEYATMVAARRAEELAFAAPIVVTSDPQSKRNLSAVAEEKGITVLDIAEILAS